MPDRLERYRRMRDPGRTPEPFGRPGGDALLAPRLFVVQKHAARRLHWDFRLELGGTLRSWAVPKGPSYDPADKRMAVEVEDHPIEYASFEGTIPAGNYGAGAVIVWDRGTWRPVGDPYEGLEKGKLVFELQGYKLRGEWTLVRTRRSQGGKQEWLLLKHRGDAWAGPGRAVPEESVLSGRLLEEIAAGTDRQAAAVAEARRLGARPRALSKADLRPMLAEPRDAPFSDPGWLFELKYDGYRMLAVREGARARLVYRSGDEATALFPEVVKAVEMLPGDAVLDGEVVVLAPDGRPSFQALQQRAQLARPDDVARASVERPATLFAFDLLSVGGLDLRPLPLADRKRVLAGLVPRLGPARFADHVEGRGEDLWREVEARGLEGMVAKRADAPYRSGARSQAWRKIRVPRTADLAVVGFTRPRGGRARFGALLLAAREGDGWAFAGSVGSGFTDRQIEDLHARLAPRARATPPCTGPVPRGRGNTWVEPEVVVAVRYTEWTAEGLLRHPVFVRVRDDARPEETSREPGPRAREAPPPVATRAPAPRAPPARAFDVTNADKVWFPPDGITKGEIVAYYRAIAPSMLPFLEDRPLVLTRYPDGIDGKSFFQKDAPEWRPEWIRTVRIPNDDGRDLDHFLVDDAEGLAWLANLGTIPIHVWASRAPELERPDWCVVDLDPKEAPFAHVVELARALHDLCDELGLPSYPKTTGQKGLHVLVPLGGKLDHAQARTLGELLARALEADHPAIATTARAIGDRGGRVYLDYLQNGRGKTIAAPYTVRPRPGAPVSTPLRWSEVGARLDPAAFTIRNVPARARRLRADPLRPVLSEAPDLLAALERLRARAASRQTPGGPRARP
ncbi:MAG TPA: DNA ligase D [Anaeromyxobacter sp.]|nr:DNA ligase D [Anaeromyxobacter sp.]